MTQPQSMFCLHNKIGYAVSGECVIVLYKRRRKEIQTRARVSVHRSKLLSNFNHGIQSANTHVFVARIELPMENKLKPKLFAWNSHFLFTKAVR